MSKIEPLQSKMASSIGKFETRSPDSEKTKKYDRQLRIWGDHGQACLEAAQVCLINATASGTETLKSLILPGIGGFTIIDGTVVRGEHAGNNFFLCQSDIGKNRAQAATRLLLELNPDVRGDYVDEDVDTLLENNPQYFSSFSIVIATAISESTLLKLSHLLDDLKVPLLVVRSYGMLGYLRLQTPEHTMIESHPESSFEDLRLDCPFPALREYVDSIDINNSPTSQKHSHIPYVVILLKALDKWQEANGPGTLPTYKEHKAFSAIINSMRWKRENGEGETETAEEENFDEAIKMRSRSLRKTEVPYEVRQLFEDESCINIDPSSKPFWVMVRALKEFVAEHGVLPLRGSIPDMHSDSESYTKLATIYKNQAEKDFQDVLSKVHDLLNSISKPEDWICEAEVRLLCKNAHALRIMRTRSIFEEYTNPNASLISERLQDVPDSNMIYYILLRAADKFFMEFKRYPGVFDDQLETDISKLKSIVCRLLQEWGVGPLSKDDFIHEMCRFGASELHTISALVGGCAAQQVIKVVTQQYVPIDNTFLFNGILCNSDTFSM